MKYNERKARKEARKAMARSAKERAKWLSVAPALINTVLGREVFTLAGSSETGEGR